jgi:hypothetical protein
VLIAMASFLMPIALLCAWLAIPGWWFLQREAHAIAQAVDAYRIATGHFPDPSDEPLMRKLGFDYGVGPRPELESVDNVRFRLRYLQGFDGPCWTFDTTSDAWTDDCTPLEAR